jgi:hypothetical protein
LKFIITFFNKLSPIILESCSTSDKGLLGFDVISLEELDDGNELDEEVA